MVNQHPAPTSAKLKRLRQAVLLLVWLMVVLILLYFLTTLLPGTNPPVTQSGMLLLTQSPDTNQAPVPFTPTAASANPPDAQASPAPTLLSAGAFQPLGEGLIVLSLAEGGYYHLFGYRSPGTPFVRLTDGPWRDLQPSLSPDGRRLAFASNRDGYWDLYLLEIASGVLQRLTFTPEFDGSPSWSSDGLWLVYESYVPHAYTGGGDLELFIRPADGSGEPIRLTNDPAADHSPAWSPSGRQIAFISTRSGESEVWLADLDRVSDRFTNISRNQNAIETHPVWSPDGGRLAWSANSPANIPTIYLWEAAKPQDAARPEQSGSWAVWNPGQDVLLAWVATPNRSYLTAYSLVERGLAMPMIDLPGSLGGMSWGMGSLPQPLPAPYQAAALLTPTALFAPVVAPESQSGVPAGRYQVVPLEGVSAPSPKLQDRVDEAYQALRAGVAQAAGWDFLSSLEQAYVPLTTYLTPGLYEDWLYTGRAFRFNTAPLNAGWLALVREDYGAETYWRVFIRTLQQDGSQGQPMRLQTWNLGQRFSGDPLAYERGGALETAIAPGYWLDFTDLAAAYGWERLPALRAWRISYSPARFNEFVYRDGMDWFAAMLELYPRSALDTPTPVSSPTPTATFTDTPTPTPTATRTPYRSPTPTATWTRRPTITPTPTWTRRPTRTPTPTNTRRPSPTPPPTQTPPALPTAEQPALTPFPVSLWLQIFLD